MNISLNMILGSLVIIIGVGLVIVLLKKILNSSQQWEQTAKIVIKGVEISGPVILIVLVIAFGVCGGGIWLILKDNNDTPLKVDIASAELSKPKEDSFKKDSILISYELTPLCYTWEMIDVDAGEIHIVNEECNGAKSGGGVYSLPNGYELTTYEYVDQSFNGCSIVEPINKISATSVRMQITCPEKGGILCTGAGKWAHGLIKLHGRKQKASSGKKLVGTFSKRVSYGEDVTESVAIIPNATCSNGGWAISVILEYSDGTTKRTRYVIKDTPQFQKGIITAENKEGASFRWDEGAKKLSVSIPTKAG